MAWFKKTKKPIAAKTKEKASRVPEGLWVKCPDCAQAIYNKDLATNLNVCPKCAHHFRIGAAERLRTLFDGEWTEYDKDLMSTDPLSFTDTKPYKARLKASIAATGLKDAVITASGAIDGIQTIREIRKIHACRDLPIIAVTAKAMKGDREKCMEAGAWDYLSKPVDTELMIGVLQAWLGH